MTLFLDTHVAVFAYAGDPDLWSPQATHMMDAATEIWLSPMVILELRYLNESGRIGVGELQIVRALEHQFGILVDRDGMGDAIFEATSLAWTRDPFDRIITAHASMREAWLLTRDGTIRDNYERAVW